MNNWIRTPNGNYQTRMEKDGKIYLSAPVSFAFAVKLGMEPHQDDQMFTCPICKAEMLYWQEQDHQCAS